MRKSVLGFVVLVMLLQPLFVCAAIVAADDDDALDLVFAGDPVVFTAVIVLPHLEPRAAVAEAAPAPVPPRAADPADHPPRLA
jgi:hypothetical protein